MLTLYTWNLPRRRAIQLPIPHIRGFHQATAALTLSILSLKIGIAQGSVKAEAECNECNEQHAAANTCMQAAIHELRAVFLRLQRL